MLIEKDHLGDWSPEFAVCCPKSLSTSSGTLQTFTQQETVTPCLLFILQPIYLHKLSPHMSSQPITSRIYQRLLYLLTAFVEDQFSQHWVSPALR